VDNVVENVLKNIPDILRGNRKKLIENADAFGEHLARNKLSTSQIRNIFNEIKTMKKFEESKDRLLLLKPKLAYLAGRHGKRTRDGLVGAVPDMVKVLSRCIDEIHNEEDFENFKQFFEAVLAYHRYYGGE